MEHKKYNQVPFGLDIVDILEQKVQELVKEHWKNDDCPPEFWVSLNNEDKPFFKLRKFWNKYICGIGI